MMILKIYLIAVLLTFVANFLMFVKFGVPNTRKYNEYNEDLNKWVKSAFFGSIIVAMIFPIVSTLALINNYKTFGGSK
jgi:hypothetical protein